MKKICLALLLLIIVTLCACSNTNAITKAEELTDSNVEISEEEVLEKLSFEDRIKLPTLIPEDTAVKRVTRTFEKLEERIEENEKGCVIRVEIIGPKENIVARRDNGSIDHIVSYTIVEAKLLEIYKGAAVPHKSGDIIDVSDLYYIAEDSKGKLTMYKHYEECAPMEPGMEYIIYGGAYDDVPYGIYPHGVFLITESELETVDYHKTDEYLDNFTKVKAKYLDNDLDD